jgi:hypothetical protein
MNMKKCNKFEEDFSEDNPAEIYLFEKMKAEVQSLLMQSASAISHRIEEQQAQAETMRRYNEALLLLRENEGGK